MRNHQKDKIATCVASVTIDACRSPFPGHTGRCSAGTACDLSSRAIRGIHSVGRRSHQNRAGPLFFFFCSTRTGSNACWHPCDPILRIALRFANQFLWGVINVTYKPAAVRTNRMRFFYFFLNAVRRPPRMHFPHRAANQSDRFPPQPSRKSTHSIAEGFALYESRFTLMRLYNRSFQETDPIERELQI